MVFTGNWMADLSILESYLDEIDYKTGTARLQKFGIKRSVGGSILFGYTFRGYLTPTKSREWCPCKKQFKTKLLSENPELLDMFEEFRDFYFPGFEFSSVQINKNYKIPRHIDSNNSGESVLISFGDYEGGLTCVEMETGLVKFDARTMPVVFDGSKYYHYVESFTGTRFSCVFFRGNN